MIRRILLIARHEFVKYVTRRGFIISLMMLPLILVLSTATSSFIASHPKAQVIAVIDRAGGYAEAIGAAAEQQKARDELRAIADYAGKYADMAAVKRADPELAALFKAPDRIASVKALAARGGWRAAFAVITGHLRPGAPVFTPPEPQEILVPPPADLTVEGAQFGSAARDYLAGDRRITTAGTAERLSAIVVIPKGFGPGAPVAAQFWSSGMDEAYSFVRGALTNALRLKTLRTLVPPERRSEVSLDVDAGLERFDPARGARARLVDRLAMFVPMGLAFLLFIVTFSNAALLLQGVVEEKSTRMIEVLLSCASPHEIMIGKLLGVAALSVLTVTVWTGSLVGVASFFSHELVAAVMAGLSGLAPVLPLIVLYFVCGLLIYSAIFLSVGATTASLPDAQALIGPASIIIVLPNFFIAMLIQDPNGTLATVISWIPIYTPYFMLVRLPFHPPAVEVWLSSALAVLTAVFMIRQTGRIFARHVLTTERPPAFGTLLKQLFGRRKIA